MCDTEKNCIDQFKMNLISTVLKQKLMKITHFRGLSLEKDV